MTVETWNFKPKTDWRTDNSQQEWLVISNAFSAAGSSVVK